MQGKSSFIVMTFAAVGVVLYVSMFSSIMTAIGTIWEYANLSTFTALETIVSIAPTVLLVSGIFAAGFAYYKGYKGAAAQDAAGVLRMVFGIVQIILFLSLFYPILTAMYTLYGTANSSYIALATVTQIAPTVLFLGGLFSGIATSYSGYRARRSKRLLA